MVVSKSIQDVRSQLTQIAGSLTMLGSPIGFARRVGSGVKAFFYEPYQGAVHGSQDFFIGLGRGTSTLFTGVVSGAMDSAVAIVGTATKGMSHLSGDADFVRKRALKRQQSKVNRGGILEGIREGGESLFSGPCSHISPPRVFPAHA
jgi:vacuolar protein sorting-associated protein 13A/C